MLPGAWPCRRQPLGRSGNFQLGRLTLGHRRRLAELAACRPGDVRIERSRGPLVHKGTIQLELAQGHSARRMHMGNLDILHGPAGCGEQLIDGHACLLLRGEHGLVLSFYGSPWTGVAIPAATPAPAPACPARQDQGHAEVRRCDVPRHRRHAADTTLSAGGVHACEPRHNAFERSPCTSRSAGQKDAPSPARVPSWRAA